MMRLIDIANATYAIGLWWQVRSGGGASRKVLLSLARNTSEEFGKENFNAVCLRVQQYGLGRINTLHIPKVPSLAAAIRPFGNQNTFLGVFCLEESLWWVCAISKGIIAADGDAFFDSKLEAERARASLRQLFSGSGGEDVLCETPEESGKYLAPLLRPENPLEPLYASAPERKKLLLRVAMAAGGLAAMLAGVMFYNHLQYEHDARELQQHAAAAIRDRTALLEHPERHFPMPWQGVPPVMEAGAQCVEAMLAQPLVWRGWSLDEMSCLPAQYVEISRSHNKGADYMTMPPGMRLVSAQKTLYRQSLHPSAGRPPVAHASLPGRDDAAALLYSVTQGMSANLESLSWEEPARTLVDGVELVAPWRIGRFTISSPPKQLIMNLGAFKALERPGVVITSVGYNSSGYIWKIQGVVYVRTK